MRAAIVALIVAGGCTGTLDAFFAGDVVDTERDVPYVAGSSNPRQMLDLYLPRGATGYPTVVFVHGGYWTAQDKDYYQPVVGLYGNVGRALARRGIGAAVINYRLVPDVTFAEQFDDVAHAIAWVQANIDRRGGAPDRLVLAGHSAGGHIAALAAFDDARLTAAGVDVTGIRGYAPLSPIFDLADMAAHPPPDRPHFNDEVTVPVFGTALAAHSPRTYFRADVAPLLVVMGDHDEPYLVTQIPAAVAEVTALGAPVEFHTLADHDHADVVLDFDTDHDAVTPLLAPFVVAVTAP